MSTTDRHSVDPSLEEPLAGQASPTPGSSATQRERIGRSRYARTRQWTPKLPGFRLQLNAALAGGTAGVHLVAISLIVATATVVFIPVLIHGFPNGADIRHHYKWTTFFSNALLNGHLYPRWLAEGNHGYGSPASVYYPPFSLYVSSLGKFILGDTLNGIALSCYLATVLSGITMYRFSRLLLSPTASLLSAALYVLSPYHVFDLYRGNSLGEYWCFVLIPLILESEYRLASADDWEAVPVLAMSYGLLLLTDVPISFLVTLALPVFLLFTTRKARVWARTLAALAIGVGLSSAYFSSVLWERRYIKPDMLLRRSYSGTFVFEKFSEALRINLLSTAHYPHYGGYLLEAELAALGLLVLCLLSSMIIFWTRPLHQGLRLKLLLATFALSGLGLIMACRVSTPIWKWLPLMSYLQVANRWLLLLTLGASILPALAISSVLGKRKRLVVAAIALAPALILSLLISAHMSTQPAVPRSQLSEWTEPEDAKEFFPPIWWDQKRDRDLDRSGYTLTSGQCDIQLLSERGANRVYLARSSTESLVRLKPLYFPGCFARIDGKEVSVQPGLAGHIQLSIPPGDHQLQLDFRDTRLRARAKIVSGLSLIVWLALIAVLSRKKRLLLKGPTADTRPAQKAMPNPDPVRQPNRRLTRIESSTLLS